MTNDNEAKIAAAPARPDNMRIWKRVEQTDKSATKDFKRAGGFSGTAINPTWQIEVMTGIFGPCGIGWGYEILEEKLVEGHSRNVYNDKGELIGTDRTVIHQLRIRLWFQDQTDPGFNRRGTIEGIGVTTMIGTYASGPFTDEEAPKKSLTDALTGCIQKLGVSADIFRGYWNDNKYVAYRQQEEAAGRGTAAQVTGTAAAPAKQLEHKAPATSTPVDVGHTAYVEATVKRIDPANDWVALGPIVDEIGTRGDLPESMKMILRGAIQAKISIIGNRPKDGPGSKAAATATA